MYRIKEERDISPETFSHMVSSVLYQRRFGPFFVEPVIAGLSKSSDGSIKPYIAGADLIGCLNFAKDFIVSGTASDKLFGVAEGLWEPDLEPEDLFETISQTLLNAVDRDAFSGWGAVVHVMSVFFQHFNTILVYSPKFSFSVLMTKLLPVHSKVEWIDMFLRAVYYFLSHFPS